jgi:hypothetical protein
MKYSKNILIGGDNVNNINFKSNKRIEMFLSIIIIGYFGIKVIYGTFFNFFPNKYYYRNIDITTNEPSNKNSQQIAMNAYVPGIWNNETSDFITLLVLSFVIYVFTNVSEKSIINEFGNLNFVFLFGYIIGLGYPPIYNNYSLLFNKEFKSSLMIRYFYLVVLIGFVLFVTVMNYSSAPLAEKNHKISYTIYVIVLVLLFFGLAFSKKNSKTYSSITYFYNNGENCSFKKDGVVQSSGDTIHITIPFMVFIILLLFSYEPNTIGMKNLYIFIYGLLLGILVSSISYYGFEYFLVKEPEKHCNSYEECVLKEMPTPQKEDIKLPKVNSQNVNLNLNNTNTSINQIKNVSIIKMMLIIAIIILSIYLIYYYIKKPII